MISFGFHQNYQKMQTYPITIGIDVSKAHLDFTVYKQLDIQQSAQIPNQLADIEQFLSDLMKKYKLDQSLFCLEATGLYSNFLLLALVNAQAAIWVENPVQIKRSLGLQRGKNDQVDAKRIAEYAYRFQDAYVAYSPDSESLDQLRYLQQLREQLVENRKRLQTTQAENQHFLAPKLYKTIQNYSDPVLKQLTEQIQAIEQKMQEILAQDENLKKI